MVKEYVLTLRKLKSNLKFLALIALFFAYSSVLIAFGEKLGVRNNEEKSYKAPAQASVLKKPQPEENTQKATVLASHVKLCANTVHSFELSYPKDWFTTYNEKDAECTLFAPFSFIAPQSAEKTFTPITLKIIPRDEWESSVKSAQAPSELFNVVKSKNLQIGNRPINYIEYFSTGNAVPKGYTKVAYLVFDSEKPMELTYTQQAEDENPEEFKKVLEEMVNSLKLF